jgi:hypothetical protein
VAKALADEANLARLAEKYDSNDVGQRGSGSDATGRRLGEVVNLRLDCTSLYNGLPMLWHDQTKVGNYDEAIRIPDTVHQLLAQRRSKTIRKIRSIIVLLIFIFEALIDLARLGRRMK